MFHRLVQMLSLVRVALWYCLGDTSESTHDTRSLSLAQVAEHSSVNEMTPTNLAIVFAPIVMRYNTTDLQQLLKLSEWENEVLELCIRHYHIVFEDASSVRANAIAANFEEELRQGGILLAKSLLQKVRSFALVDRRSLRLVSLSLSLSLTIVMRAPSTVSNKQWPRSRPRLSPLAPSVYSLRYEQLASLTLSLSSSNHQPISVAYVTAGRHRLRSESICAKRPSTASSSRSMSRMRPRRTRRTKRKMCVSRSLSWRERARIH